MEEYCKSIFVFSHLNTLYSSEIHFGTLPITVHCFFCLYMNYKIQLQNRHMKHFIWKLVWLEISYLVKISALQYYGIIYPTEKHQNPTNSATLFNDE